MANAKSTKSTPVEQAGVQASVDARQLGHKAAGFRLKDLVDRVVATTGSKRNIVRPIVESTLKALGEAFDAGEHLSLPPLGRAKVNRSKDMADATVLTIKLRRGATT